MPFTLIDTHCHLDFNQFNADRREVIDRAIEAGVEKFINPGIDYPSSAGIIRLAEAYPSLYAAIGIHPNDSAGWSESQLADLKALTKHPKVVAIGEIGLDYYRHHSPREVQVKLFEQQCALAAEVGLPVIVHNRNASADVLSALARYVETLEASRSPLAERPGVLHSFSGAAEDARRAIEMKFLIGISGPVTFQNAHALQALVAELPLQAMIIETDSPFLSPHPQRGKRNEPAYVAYVAEKIAQLKGAPLEEVARVTTNNAARLFRWSENH